MTSTSIVRVVRHPKPCCKTKRYIQPRNPYYDSAEFKARWFSSETVESIALDLDVTLQAVRNAALRRGWPIKTIARTQNVLPHPGANKPAANSQKAPAP